MTQHDRSSFDEQAALAELERLQEAIQSARRQRMQVNDEFDTFVRTIRQRPPGDVPPTRHVRSSDHPRVSGTFQSEPPRLASPPPPPPAVTPLALTSSAEDRLAPIVEAPAMLESSGRPRRPRSHQIAVAAVAIVVVAGIFLLFPRSATPPDTGQASENATPTAPTPAPVAPVPTSSAPVPAAPVQIEVTTVRRVWMRVIVDGERVVEREVPAGQQLRYSANREITVRAGDAGAVHVRVGTGEPVSLGRDGFPVTRTYR